MKKLNFFLCALAYANLCLGQNSQVKFSAEIANRNKDIIYIQDDNMKNVAEIKINKKGIFESDFKVEQGLYTFFDGVETGKVYLKDGFDLHLKMDAKQFDETMSYSGKGAEENNYLAKNFIDNEVFMTQNKDREFDDFYAVFDAKKKKDFEELAKSNFDAIFKVQAKDAMSMDFLDMQRQYKKAQKAKKNSGQPSASFDYVNYAGGKTKLEDLRGKYVYIDVWATWCGPCRAELPHLKKIEEKYHGKNIAFVSISVDEDKDLEKWKTFVKDKELGGIQLFADANFDSDFIKSYDINSIPRFILLDPTGLVIKSDADRPSQPALQAELDKLLN